MSWQALKRAVLLAAVVAPSRKRTNCWRNKGSQRLGGVVAKAETNRTILSAEARRRWWWLKRGVRVLEKAEKKIWVEFDLIEERSFSFRMCVAFDAFASSRILPIFSMTSRISSPSRSTLATAIAFNFKSRLSFLLYFLISIGNLELEWDFKVPLLSLFEFSTARF